MTQPDMPLFSIQFAIKTSSYQHPCVTLVAVDVFAPDRQAAVTIATQMLREPDRYDIDSVVEN